MLLASAEVSSPVGLIPPGRRIFFCLFYGAEPERLAEISCGVGQRGAHRGLKLVLCQQSQ